MKRRFSTLLSAIALTAGLSGAMSSPAIASESTEGTIPQHTSWSPGAFKAPASSDSDTPVVTETTYEEDCVTEGNKTTCTRGSASASSTAQSSSIADIRIKGRIAGEYFIKGGLTKKQVAGKKCRWVSGGYNSARRADGSPFSYRDERKQYVCKTGKGPTGFQVVKCGNPYAPKGWQPTYVVVRNPVVVRSLNKYKLTGRAKVRSVSDSYSVSETTATCVGSNGYGYSEAASDAKAFARIRFTFRHRSSFSGALRNAIIRHNESINVTGFAKVATKTSTKAKTDANCSDQEEQPPTYQCPPGTTWEDKDGDGKQEEGECITPPPTYTPPSATMPVINDVVEYNSRTITYTLSGNPGEMLQVVADAKHGGSITAGKTQSITLDSNGNGTGTVTFVAGEVPKEALEYYIGSTKYTIAAGKDVVWIQVRDSRGNTVWAKSNDFDITPRPATP